MLYAKSGQYICNQNVFYGERGQITCLCKGWPAPLQARKLGAGNLVQFGLLSTPVGEGKSSRREMTQEDKKMGLIVSLRSMLP